MNKNMKKVMMTMVIISTLVIGGFLGKEYMLSSNKTSNSTKLTKNVQKKDAKKI